MTTSVGFDPTRQARSHPYRSDSRYHKHGHNLVGIDRPVCDASINDGGPEFAALVIIPVTMSVPMTAAIPVSVTEPVAIIFYSR
jgi:hypothetical protein